MAWIESHQSLANHRKLMRLCAQLGVSRPQAIGHLHLLWWWALDNVGPDGDLGDITDEELAMAAQWDGDPHEFADALTRSGFVDVHEDGSRWLHDWWDYAGKLLDKRARDRERMRQARGSSSSGLSPSRDPSQDKLRDQSQERPATVAGPSQDGSETVRRTQPNPTQPTYPPLPSPPRGGRNPLAGGEEGVSPPPDAALAASEDESPGHRSTGARASPRRPRSPRGDEPYSPDFEAFWEVYPRRVDKGAAWRAWRARMREGHTPDEMLSAARHYAEAVEELGVEVQYRKHPATFLGPGRPFVEWVSGVPEGFRGRADVPQAWHALRAYLEAAEDGHPPRAAPEEPVSDGHLGATRTGGDLR